jgi:hypothetical protein
MCEIITKISDNSKHRINSASQELTHGQVFVLVRMMKEDLLSFSGPIVIFLTFMTVLYIMIIIITNFITNKLS